LLWKRRRKDEIVRRSDKTYRLIHKKRINTRGREAGWGRRGRLKGKKTFKRDAETKMQSMKGKPHLWAPRGPKIEFLPINGERNMSHSQ